MQRCPLCRQLTTHILHQDKKRRFYTCDTCGLIFSDASQHLPPTADKRHYSDSYRTSTQKQLAQFIQLFIMQLQRQQTGYLTGLNFGQMLDDASICSIQQAGHRLSQYDPCAQTDYQLLKTQYDFVCCYRICESFQDPLTEWMLLSRLLLPDGWLAINTPLVTDINRFAKWHYKNNLHHVSFYQQKTFAYLAQHSSFELLFAAKELVLMQKTS